MQVQLTLIATSEQEARSLSGILDLVTGGLSGKKSPQIVETKALSAAPEEKSKKEKDVSKKSKKPSLSVVDDDDDDLGDTDDEDLTHIDLDDDDESAAASDIDDEDDDIVPTPKKRGPKPKGAKVEAKAETKTEAKISQSDVIAAFKKFAQEQGREKAGKILAKYDVKAVRDLDADTYPSVMKLLRK